VLLFTPIHHVSNQNSTMHPYPRVHKQDDLAAAAAAAAARTLPQILVKNRSKD
jgi:hypothetical protein